MSKLEMILKPVAIEMNTKVAINSNPNIVDLQLIIHGSALGKDIAIEGFKQIKSKRVKITIEELEDDRGNHG